MNYTDFENKYKPTDIHYDWTQEYDAAVLKNTNNKCIWTASDSEVNGNVVLTPGYSVANRLYHIICDVPIVDSDVNVEVML